MSLLLFPSSPVGRRGRLLAEQSFGPRGPRAHPPRAQTSRGIDSPRWGSTRRGSRPQNDEGPAALAAGPIAASPLFWSAGAQPVGVFWTTRSPWSKRTSSSPPAPPAQLTVTEPLPSLVM